MLIHYFKYLLTRFYYTNSRVHNFFLLGKEKNNPTKEPVIKKI